MSAIGVVLAAWSVTFALAPEPDGPADSIALDDDEGEPADAERPDPAETELESEPPDVPPPPSADASRSPGPVPERNETQAEGTGNVPNEAAIERDSSVSLKDERRPAGRYKPPGSRQRFEAEFKIGPYLPDVDSNYDGPGLGPYSTIFGPTDALGNADGEAKVGVMPAFAFEYQFIYFGGPFGVGAQLAFFRDTAKALLAAPVPGESVRSEADRVRFAMVPLVAFVGYRFELLADRFRWVPLVPYAKAGLAYTFWWTRDGSGDISRDSMGRKGRGGVLGWQLNAGGMLRLDFIEPGTAKKLDQTTGINHTYVFGELQLSRVNNFGVGNSIALGDTTWFAGLAIEF